MKNMAKKKKMINRNKLFSITLIIPAFALALVQFVSLDALSVQSNTLAASVTFASLLATFSVWHKGMHAVLLSTVAGLALRTAIIAFLMNNGFSKSEQLLVCSYVIGYHFLEAALIAIVFSRSKMQEVKEEKVRA